MSVYMLTTRKGGKAEAMIAATRKLKATAEKAGPICDAQPGRGGSRCRPVGYPYLVRQLGSLWQSGGIRYHR